MEKIQLKQIIDTGKKPTPLLFAHRGALLEAPENTIPAFERAIELGADGIEFDVLLTKDRVPIITHNNDLSRLTHFDGLVHETPFSTIRSLDFGSHYRTSFSNITAPTLTEVFELLQRHDISIICELKSQPGMAASLAELAGGILSDFHFRNSVILSSFNIKILYYLKKIFPHIPRALAIKRRAFPFFPWRLFATLLDVAEIHASLPMIVPSFIAKVRQHDWRLDAWTVNEPSEIDLCLSLGVQGIITDDVARVKKYLELKQ
jgi:glycerophosphoryl diester phosphodiesterase